MFLEELFTSLRSRRQKRNDESWAAISTRLRELNSITTPKQVEMPTTKPPGEEIDMRDETGT
jgi:hypothetical protein